MEYIIKDISLIDLSAIIGNFSQAFSLLFVAIGALLTVRGLRLQWKSHDQSLIFGLYQKYFELVIQYPQYQEMTEKEFDDLASTGGSDLKRYQWFVHFVLTIFEEIIRKTKNDAEWQSSLKDQLATHRYYLRSQDMRSSMQYYSREMQAIIREAAE